MNKKELIDLCEKQPFLIDTRTGEEWKPLLSIQEEVQKLNEQELEKIKKGHDPINEV